MTIAPTLIIGVGGKGSEIVERVARKLDGDESKRVQFVVMDTDANELGAIKRRNPGLHTIQTSSDMTVEEALRSNPYAAHVWFPRNHILEGKALSEGAGQVRAISRLAFESCIAEGKLRPLHDAVAQLQLLSTDAFSQGVRVVVAGTLAGGTGSGVFLPLGMYLNHYLKAECNVRNVNVRGFFLLPDVLANTVLRDNVDQQQNMRANAYAAVRELDAFVARADGEDQSAYPAVELDFPVPGSTEREQYPKVLPYDHVFLMDYQNADGKTLSTLDDYLQYAADTIFAFAVSPMSQRSNSSEDNEIRKIANVAANGHCRYVGAGSAEVCYPIDRIADYVALRWAEESIGDEWVRIDREVEQVVARRKRDGDEVDWASEYLACFEGHATSADPSNRFFVSLMRQVNGVVSNDGTSGPVTVEKELYPSLSSVLSVAQASLSYDSQDDDELGETEEGEPTRTANSQADDFLLPIMVDDGAVGRYIAALRASAEDALGRQDSYRQVKRLLESKKQHMTRDSADQVDTAIAEYVAALAEFQKVVQAVAPKVARQLAIQVFTLTQPEDALEDGGETSFGHYLRKAGSTDNRELIHPNAVRYVAYRATKKFEEMADALRANMSRLDELVTSGLNMTYNGGDKAGMSAAEYAGYLTSTTKEGRTLLKSAAETIAGVGGNDEQEALRKIHNELTNPLALHATRLEYWAQLCVMKAVADEALGFFNALNASYRDFYRYLESEIPRIRRRIASVEEDKLLNAHTVEHDGRLGCSTRYVCADRTSLKAIYAQTPRSASPDELEGHISAAIYVAALKKAEHDRTAARLNAPGKDKDAGLSMAARRRRDEERREERRAFFRRAYEESVIDFWKRKVIDDYAGLIDVDVIQAIRNEAEYNGLTPTVNANDYVRQVLGGGWTLSQIFLQQTANPESDRLKASLYDEALIDVDDGEKQAILKGLDDAGGEGARGVGRYRILFYQACYGIAVARLDKFSVPRDVPRDDYLAVCDAPGSRPGGLYYTAYAELIRNLTDNLKQGSYISPHLDARWHLAFLFPDIDEAEAARQRYNVIRAFTYAVLFGKVKSEVLPAGLRYRKVLDGNSSDLTTRDGVCDSFAEVFEAHVYNNRLVYRLLADCEAARERAQARSLGESPLAINLQSAALGYAPVAGAHPSVAPAWQHVHLRDFEVTSPSLPGIAGVSNVYELPLFYEATLPAISNHGVFVEEMIEAMQDIVFAYICCFEPEAQAYNTAADFYLEQYERYQATCAMLLGGNPKLTFLKSMSRIKDKVRHWFEGHRTDLDVALYRRATATL